MEVVSQGVEIQGDLKVSEMLNDNKQNEIVVRSPDGTLKTREARSLTLTDTVRTLVTDIQLAAHLCNCAYLPPFLINSALAAGYTIEDLVGGGVSIANLLDGGLSVADLLTGGQSVADLIAAGLSISDLLNGGASVDDLIAEGIGVQALLDAGAIPIDIYNAGLPLDSLYGKTYQGGLIAYLNTTNGTGLIAAQQDQDGGSGIQWYNGSYTTTGATATSFGSGQSNTTTIISNQGPGTYAATICDNYSETDGDNTYDDWYLPSRDELYELYKNLHRYGCSAAPQGGWDYSSCSTGLGGFVNDSYWSSTETSINVNAYAQGLDQGPHFVASKDNTYRVRAVRSF